MYSHTKTLYPVVDDNSQEKAAVRKSRNGILCPLGFSHLGLNIFMLGILITVLGFDPLASSFLGILELYLIFTSSFFRINPLKIPSFNLVMPTLWLVTHVWVVLVMRTVMKMVTNAVSRTLYCNYNMKKSSLWFKRENRSSKHFFSLAEISFMDVSSFRLNQELMLKASLKSVFSAICGSSRD